MDWQAARDNTILYWRQVRESLDTLEDVELLRQINAVNDLCEKAREQSHGEMGRCSYCLAYQQFGGCLAIGLEMSECVVEGRRGDLRVLVDQFISQLEDVDLSDSLDGSPL